MPKLTIEQPHNLPLEEVQRRLKDLASRLATKYEIDAQWVTATEAKIKRTGVSGNISCSDKKVTVFLVLAFMLSPIKDKVESRVRQELQNCLS